MTIADKLLTPDEAAAILDIPIRTLKLWRLDNLGPPYCQFGPRTIRYRSTDLERWIEQQTITPGEHDGAIS